jgi:ubiquinone/menaquinone biosynthesis C-methylase UbiE
MSRHKIQEDRERSFEDQIADRYDRDYHESPIMSANAKNFVEFLSSKVRPGDRILDLGCASASLWPHYKAILSDDVQITGMDLSPRMIEIARERYPEDIFKVGSFFDIGFEPGSFDVVVVSSALHHIGDDLLPTALTNICSVLEEHGQLVGREPLCVSRLTDKGGWFSGAVMNLRHLAYRLTRTKEYPEPDPGPDHHAYDPRMFIDAINKHLTVTDVQFKHPVSLMLSRSTHPTVTAIALHLDEAVGNRGGQEIFYAARKNFAAGDDVRYCIEQSFASNEVSPIDRAEFLIQLQAAAEAISLKIADTEARWTGKHE